MTPLFPKDSFIAAPAGKPARVLQKILGNRTPFALFDQGLVSGANFATNVLLARTLGLRDYGVFALCWIYVLFINSLQYAVIISPMVSVGPKQSPEERPHYFGAVLVHEGIFVSVAAVFTYFGVWLSKFIYPEWGVAPFAGPLALATAAYLLQDFLRRYFFCIQSAKLALTTDIVSYLTQIPILFWATKHHYTSLTLIFAIIGSTSLLGFLACLPFLEKIVFTYSSLKAISRRHWQISRWLLPSAFMKWGAGNLFLMSAPIYYGAAATAALRAAQNIVAVSHIWFLGLDNVIPAEASRRIRQKGLNGMTHYLGKMTMLWGGITAGFMAMVAAAPRFWLHLVYGSKFDSNVTVLRLYALLYLITFFSSPLQAALQSIEYTAPIFWAYPALILFSVVLAGPFAKTLGLNGVILGMCATQLVFQGIIATALMLKIRKLRMTDPSTTHV